MFDLCNALLSSPLGWADRCFGGTGRREVSKPCVLIYYTNLMDEEIHARAHTSIYTHTYKKRFYYDVNNLHLGSPVLQNIR